VPQQFCNQDSFPRSKCSCFSAISMPENPVNPDCQETEKMPFFRACLVPPSRTSHEGGHTETVKCGQRGHAPAGTEMSQAGAGRRPQSAGTGRHGSNNQASDYYTYYSITHVTQRERELSSGTHTHTHKTESHTISRRSLSLSQRIVHSVSAAAIRLRADSSQLPSSCYSLA